MSLRSLLNRCLSLACAAVGAVALTGSLSAQTTQFAQFVQQDGALRAFTYSNNGTSASFNSNVAGGIPVFFLYSPVIANQLPSDLQGFQDARMVMTSSTTVTAVPNGSGGFNETFNQTTTITFTRTTPASQGQNARTNLLTVVLTNYTQSFGGNAASIDASTPSATITFTSDFLDFSNTNIRAAALSFTGSNVAITQNANGFLNNFNIAGTGNFSSNPVPIVTVPEVSPAALLGLIVAGAGAVEFGRQRRRRAAVPAPAKDDEPAMV